MAKGGKKSASPEEVCMGCCVAISIALIIVGGIFTDKAIKNDRDKTISEYNSRIQKWNSYLSSSQFTNLNVQAISSPGVVSSAAQASWASAIGPMPWTLASTTTVESIADKYGPGYTTTQRYEANSNTMFGASVFDLTQNYNISVYVKAGSSSTTNEVLRSYTTIPTFFRTQRSKSDLGCSKSCDSTCRGLGGSWSSSSSICTTNYAIDAVCVKIRESTTGGWKTSVGDFGGDDYGGCNLLEGKLRIGGYRSISDTSISYDLTTIKTIKLRHADDPWIWVLFTTTGSFDFGIDKYTASVVGGVCLAIGLLPWCLGCLLIIYEVGKDCDFGCDIDCDCLRSHNPPPARPAAAAAPAAPPLPHADSDLPELSVSVVASPVNENKNEERPKYQKEVVQGLDIERVNAMKDAYYDPNASADQYIIADQLRNTRALAANIGPDNVEGWSLREIKYWLHPDGVCGLQLGWSTVAQEQNYGKGEAPGILTGIHFKHPNKSDAHVLMDGQFLIPPGEYLTSITGTVLGQVLRSMTFRTNRNSDHSIGDQGFVSGAQLFALKAENGKMLISLAGLISRTSELFTCFGAYQSKIPDRIIGTDFKSSVDVKSDAPPSFPDLVMMSSEGDVNNAAPPAPAPSYAVAMGQPVGQPTVMFVNPDGTLAPPPIVVIQAAPNDPNAPPSYDNASQM